jgi:hypothetical protein
MNSLLTALQGASIQTDIYGLTLATVISFLAAICVALLYYAFFENIRRGAQAHRFFLVGGPAITVMLLAIQFSLPLSLGLLGALSIIRFRTPVKEPEEVAYILLLIALSITCATFNFKLTGIMLVVATFALYIQRALPAAFLKKSKNGLLMVTIAGEGDGNAGQSIQAHVPGSKLESLSAHDGFTSYHYSFESRGDFNTENAIKSIRESLSPEKISIVFNE